MTTSVIPPGMTKCLTCGLFYTGGGCPACQTTRLTLYGITGKVQATYDLKPGDKVDVEHRPVFTVTRIVLEPVDVQEKLGA